MGIALGDRARGVKRTMVAAIGDGSFQYSVQAIWTAAQHKLPIVFVVLRNGAYAILKSFALLEETPDVPGLDLPGLDIASLATGFGCRTATVEPPRSWPVNSRRRLKLTGPRSSWCPPSRTTIPGLIPNLAREAMPVYTCTPVRRR